MRPVRSRRSRLVIALRALVVAPMLVSAATAVPVTAFAKSKATKSSGAKRADDGGGEWRPGSDDYSQVFNRKTDSERKRDRDLDSPPLDEYEKRAEKEARQQIEKILGDYRKHSHRNLELYGNPHSRTPWSDKLSLNSARLQRLEQENALHEKARWEGEKQDLLEGGFVQASEFTLDPKSETPRADLIENLNSLKFTRKDEVRNKERYEKLVADFERVTGRKPTLPVGTYGPTPYTDLFEGMGYAYSGYYASDKPAAKAMNEVVFADRWGKYVEGWTKNGLLRADEIAVDKSLEYPYAAAKLKYEALYAARNEDLRYKTYLDSTLKPYQERTGRLPAGLLDPSKPQPYFDIYSRKRSEVAKIDDENRNAREWARLLPEWTRSGLFQPAELAVDSTKDYFYAETLPKITRLYSDRRNEVTFKTRVEEITKPYVARMGRMPAGLIDNTQTYPYSDLYNRRYSDLRKLSYENDVASVWRNQVALWTTDGIIDPKELVLDLTHDYPYTELTAKIGPLYEERRREKEYRKQYEATVTPYIQRMGRPFPNLFDASQKNPYTYAMTKQRQVIGKISTENDNAARWPAYFAKWTKDGVLNPADVVVDLKASDYPYTEATEKFNELYDKLRVEVENRKKIEELAAYYKELGRTDVNLTPLKGAKTPYADLVFKYQSLIEGLPRELEAKRKLETLRRVQIKAGDPKPIPMPPQGTTSMRPYQELLADSAELLVKYDTAIKEERLPELIEALKTRVYTVQRPFYTYHWGDRTRLGNYWTQSGRSADDVWGSKMVQGAVPVYYNTNASISGNRDGFYAAVDPNATSSYGLGHGDWYLNRLEVPPGTRFLSTFELDEVLNNNAELLRDLGCSRGWSTSGTGLMISHPGKGNNGEITACDRITRRLIEELKIDAVLYGYTHTQYKDCVGGKYNGKLAGAFLFTNGNWIKPGNVRTFTKDTRDATDERKFIQKLFAEKTQGYYGMSPAVNKLWDDINPAKDLPGDAEMKDIKARNLLRCGDFVRVVPLEKRYQCIPEEGALPKNVDELMKSLQAVGGAR